MSDPTTGGNDQHVQSFLESIEDEQRKADCSALVEMMQRITGHQPRLWNNSIIGFGSYHYKYESGREGDWFLTGCSPRKQHLSVYIIGGLSHHEEKLEKLGQYKRSKACLYIRALSDVKRDVLEEIISASVRITRETYPSE